jgi:DNA gyrase subunit A
MVAALQVSSEHELMMISSTGTLVRTPVGEISIVGRNTQGVRLIRLDESERLTGIERIETLGDESGTTEPRPETLGGENEGSTDTPAS